MLARRAQLHFAGDDVIVFSRNGNDVTRRFGQVAAAVAGLRAKSVVIDAELVACDADGNLNFYAMMGGAKHGCCAWCFDLLELNGHDLRSEPLDSRRERLRQLLIAANNQELRFSGDLHDPIKLLDAADRMGLEGIVSKRRDQHYRSGKNPGWVKVKTTAWRAANRDRWEMFAPK